MLIDSEEPPEVVGSAPNDHSSGPRSSQKEQEVGQTVSEKGKAAAPMSKGTNGGSNSNRDVVNPEMKRSTAVATRGSNHLNKGNEGPSGPRIDVSHPNLVEGLKLMSNTGPHKKNTQGSKSVRPALADITNQISTWPTGPQEQSNAHNGKGIKRVNQASVDEEVIEFMSPRASVDQSDLQTHDKLVESGRGRPSDPTHVQCSIGDVPNPILLNRECQNPSRDLGTSEEGRGAEASPSNGEASQDEFMQENLEERHASKSSSTLLL